jgi:hypothetical protein
MGVGGYPASAQYAKWNSMYGKEDQKDLSNVGNRFKTLCIKSCRN